ncbi:MAG: tellurium resistance TerZ family protein [Muribaculaceae bacterium]|nr:tellurium resistance TerZ family protein [Muribaculaceae bacterium]
MSIRLVKGQIISLENSDGTPLSDICVGCGWGAIVRNTGFLNLTKKIEEIDIDLSVVMYDGEGRLVDHLYSPLYRLDFLRRYGLPQGKVYSKDRALHHSGDERTGTTSPEQHYDNEVVTVDLDKISPEIHTIFFFLNNCGREDFLIIPNVHIRIYVGTPTKVNSVIASYRIPHSKHLAGTTAMVMGKLERSDNGWIFTAIGDAYSDPNICETIGRISQHYIHQTTI